MLVEGTSDGRLRCLACNRHCLIPNAGVGFCGVRANITGELKLLVRNKPAAVWIDPIEKKPFFHFLPGSRSFSLGTFGCNFACSFCQNWDLSQAHTRGREYFENLLRNCDEWSPERIVEEALTQRCKSISFTYNEPTIFTEYALDVMELARKKGLKGTYVTNGYETKECWDALVGKIDAANIDLKAYNQRFYTELCKVPNFEKIKDSVEYAKSLGIWVEVTTLLVPGWNDDPIELKAEADWLANVDPSTPWHVTTFHPDYQMLNSRSTSPESLIHAHAIGIKSGLKYVYCGNLAGAYSNYETTFCPSCRRDLIIRFGYVVSENNTMNGKCKFCKTKINGVWE